MNVTFLGRLARCLLRFDVEFFTVDKNCLPRVFLECTATTNVGISTH